jgi:hypothetical protein
VITCRLVAAGELSVRRAFCALPGLPLLILFLAVAFFLLLHMPNDEALELSESEFELSEEDDSASASSSSSC